MVLGHHQDQEKVAKQLDQWVKKMKCSGETGMRIESFKDINVGVDPSSVQEDCESFDPITKDDIKKIRNKNLNGKCTLELKNGDTVDGFFKNGLRHGLCQVRSSKMSVEEIVGEYKEGALYGRATVKFSDKTMIVGYFKAGILHGFARYFDKKGRLYFVGNHTNGLPYGTCWKIIRGGGCVVGRVDRTGRLTGTKNAYIYPDFVTSLVGVFKDGVMERGQEAEITGSFEDKVGIRVPVFSKPVGPFHVRQIRTFCQSLPGNIKAKNIDKPFNQSYLACYT